MQNWIISVNLRLNYSERHHCSYLNESECDELPGSFKRRENRKQVLILTKKQDQIFTSIASNNLDVSTSLLIDILEKQMF